MLSVLLVLLAQQTNAPVQGPRPPAPPAAEVKPEDLCGVEGKVVNLASGEPVKKAAITLRRAEPGPGGYQTSFTTTTDDGGKFALKDIEAGRYRLHVMRTGFVGMEYGAKGPSRQGTTLTLKTAQRMSGVDFKLTPHAVIAGRILDSDGEPQANVQVNAMIWRYTPRGKQLMQSGWAGTNDLGEFRMFGLPPGKYFLKATSNTGSWTEGVDRSARNGPEDGYVPTYFPGTIEVGSASTLEVTPGQQMLGIEVRLSKARTVRVRGRVLNAGGGRSPIMVALSRRDDSSFAREARAAASGPDARFEIRGVAPGSYTISAVEYDGQTSLSGQQPVDVGDSNLDNVEVTMQAPVPVPGEVKVEGAAPDAVKLANLRVGLRPRDLTRPMYVPMPTGVVQADGTFQLKGAAADQLLVSVSGLPEGYYVKSATMGEQEGLESGLNLASGAGGSMRVVIAPGAGQLEGSVTNEKQEPASGVTVVAIPEREKRRELFQYVKSATTDQYGRFSLKGVDPGDYRLYAWEDVETGAWMDLEFMKPLESKAKKVTLREGGRETLELQVIPPG